MILFSRPGWLPGTVVVCLGLLLAACGGGGSSAGSTLTGSGGASGGPPADKSELVGSVAVGAAVSGATVSVKCESGTTISAVTSNPDGSYTIDIPDANFPCILKATGGNLPAGTAALHSFATAGNATVNITPLTDLALVLALKAQDGRNLADWFNSPGNWSSVSSGIETALGELRSLLENQGYTLPTTWTVANLLLPFTETFTPSVTPAADTLDRLLEDIAAAIADDLSNYDAVLAALVSGGAFPQAVEEEIGGTGGVLDPVPAATLGDDPSPSQGAFLTLVSQTWPVAIYAVPDGNEAWYGEGSLTIGGVTSNWTMELRGADDSIIASMDASGALTSALTAFYEQDLGVTIIHQPGQVFINKGTAISQHLNAFVEWDTGLIEGFAGGNGQVKFRNSMEAYGEGVPDIFADLAGDWSGLGTVSCNGPFGPFSAVTNTAIITAGGQVTIDGQTQLCGGVLPQVLSWAGKDDFLIPDPEETDGSYIMHLDSQNLSNVSAGKFQIRFHSDMGVRSMSGFLPDFFEMNNLEKTQNVNE